MKYIKIKNIRLKGLRSLADEQSFSVPANGLVGIKGSSGAGKTNLHYSISYPLGYCPLPQSELQSWEWLTSNKLQVEIDFDTHLGPVTLARGEKSFIKIGDKIVNASAKAIGTELQKLVELPLDLLEALTYRPQGEPARFVSMTDSQKKEFLSQVLGLEAVEKEVEERTKAINLTWESLDTKSTVISTLKGEIKEIAKPHLESVATLEADLEIKTVALEMGKAILSDIEKEIKETGANFTYDTSKINGIDTSLAIELAQKTKLENQLAVNKQKIQKIIQEKNKLLTKLQEEIKSLEAIHPRIVAKTAVLNGLMKATCPTCEQDWIPKDDKYAKTKEELYVLAEQYCKLDDVKNTYDTLTEEVTKLRNEYFGYSDPELVEVTKRIHSLEIERAHEQAEMKLQKENALKGLYLEYSANKDNVNSAIHQRNSVTTKINEIKSRNDYLQKTYQKELANNEALLARIAKEQADFDLLKTTYETESDYVELLKAFLGSIFEEVLYEISLETNELLKCLPNVETRTIQFVTERVTQKGTTKQEIRPVVMINGNPCSLKSLSGGQENSVGLAIDLAVASVITKRTGMNLGWQIFDESFDGMDLKTKESCLELLKKAAQDKVIFTIDHFSEINEMYEKVLYVDNVGESSTIREIDAI